MGGIAVGLATMLYLSTKGTSEAKPQQRQNEELKECPRDKLLNILEDLRIEYTPYYTHFYHMLVALRSEYSEKPVLQRKLRDKIKDSLEQRVEQI